MACTRILWGKGGCGGAAQKNHTLVVDDVETVSGHVTCDNASRSEMVIPVCHGGSVVVVLDIESSELRRFSSADRDFIEQCVAILEEIWPEEEAHG
ncbi:MAG: GAF domain-containing protein [Bacillota bacterium]|nr:GAF domain-containing protein [Bacillota bacterium]